jgi:pimeloyl-ACP methyl ester carboxylesterase
MLSTKQSINVDGIPVAYYTAGQGPGIVFLHGASGHPETSFASLLDYFTRHRTVIIPAYSGSNLTPLPDGELDIDLLANQVLEVAKAASHGPVDFFGTSTGAVVAAVAAAKEPEVVRRMVLLGGSVHYHDPWERLFMRIWFRLAELDANVLAEFTLLHGHSADYLDSLSASERMRIRAALIPSEGFIALLKLLDRLDISDYVRKIKSPTLVVGMKQDQLVPTRYAKKFHDAIPGSEYAEIDSGHIAASEKPEELCRIMEKFLST